MTKESKLKLYEYESQHKRAVTMQAGPPCMYGLGVSDVNFMLTNQVLACTTTAVPVAQDLPGLEAIDQKIAWIA